MKILNPISVAAATVCLALGLSVTVAASGSSRPFKASIHSFAGPAPTTDRCVLANAESGSAQVTHLGKSAMESNEFGNLCSNPEGADITGQFTMTAANGDQLFGSYDTLGHLDFANDEVTFSGPFTPPFDVFAQMKGRISY